MVEQQDPILVKLHDQKYINKRNLPGQRLGAKAWYEYFRAYFTSAVQFEWCAEQPCVAKTADAVLLIHVDDIL